MPSLRERPGDIILLAQHFMRSAQSIGELPKLDPAVQEYLRTREYPGNVRDLKQLVSRMMYRHVGPGPITIGDIPDEERPMSPNGMNRLDEEFQQAVQLALALGLGLRDIRSMAETTAFQAAISASGGSLRQAAEQLGVTKRAVELRRQARRRVGFSSTGEEPDED